MTIKDSVEVIRIPFRKQSFSGIKIEIFHLTNESIFVVRSFSLLCDCQAFLARIFRWLVGERELGEVQNLSLLSSKVGRAIRLGCSLDIS